MVSYIQINGFDEFDKYVGSIDPNGPPVFFFFSGEKLATGKSWCPDCVEASYVQYFNVMYLVITKRLRDTLCLRHFSKPLFYFVANNQMLRLPEVKQPSMVSSIALAYQAEPIVKTYLTELNRSLIFAYVDVGNREYWKDRACPFRTDSRIKLMVIPTLIRWKGVQRLEGEQCAKRDLLQMMFEEEE